eukprot:224550_1
MEPTNVTLLYVALIIPVVVIIRYGVKYYRNINHFAIKKRYGRIVVVEAMIQSILLINVSVQFFSNIHQALIYVYYQVNSTLFIILMSCWFVRFSALCIDITWITTTRDRQWIYIINSGATQLNTQKLQKYKRTLGNIRWNFAHVVIPWCIFCFVIFAFLNVVRAMDINVYDLSDQDMFLNLYILDGISWLFWLFIILSSWAVLLIIYLKIPKFQDSIYVMKELKYVIASLTIQLSMNTVGSILYASRSDEIWYYTVMFVSHLSGAIATIIATRFVLINVLPMKQPSNRQEINPLQHNPDILEMQLSLMSNMAESNQSYELKQILNDKQMFQVYMFHLSKEFSMKLLLALIECIQLQKYILTNNDNIDINIVTDQEYSCQKITFYSDIVKSVIVFNDYNETKIDDVTRIKKKADKLYNKYIEYNSNYEISITCQTRDSMSDVMSHLDWIEDDSIRINDVMLLFDECCKEIYLILLSGFGRFQATKQYKMFPLKHNYQSLM